MKMLISSVVVSSCFIVESIMQILSAIYLSPDAQTIYTSLFYAFDLIALFSILLLFRQAIHEEVSNRFTKTYRIEMASSPNHSHLSKPLQKEGAGEISLHSLHGNGAGESSHMEENNNLKDESTRSIASHSLASEKERRDQSPSIGSIDEQGGVAWNNMPHLLHSELSLDGTQTQEIELIHLQPSRDNGISLTSSQNLVDYSTAT